MSVYAYTAVGGDSGRPVARRGTITADTPRQARDQLRAQGLSVRDITEQAPGKSQGWRSRYLAGRHAAQVTGLLQEMATLLAAGIPLLESLDTIARPHTGRFQRAILLLRDHVAAGGSLAEAMSRQPALFDDLCISIIEVGQSAGTLENALVRLVEFRRRSAGQKNRAASALMYPAIVLFVGVGVSIFLMTYVVPNLLSVLIDSGKELPTATLVVKGASDFLLNWWWAILLFVAVTASAINVILRTARGQLVFHQLQLKIPLVGDLIRKQTIGRMAMVMATLLKSDLTFVKAVQIAQRTVRNQVMRQALVSCEQAVCAGRDIAQALEKTQAFPPLVIQIFSVGQASGRLEQMLDNLAADYDTQVDITAGRLTALLEPIMMILLAIAVGFIAFATILPILEAGDIL